MTWGCSFGGDAGQVGHGDHRPDKHRLAQGTSLRTDGRGQTGEDPGTVRLQGPL